MLRISSELGQRRTFEWVDEKLEDLEEDAAPLGLAKAEGLAKDPERFPSKSKAEEKEEEEAHRPKATRELAHPLEWDPKEEAEAEVGVSTVVSVDQWEQDDVS